MKIKLDIENKIIFPLLILIILPIIFFSLISYYNSYQMLSEKQIDHMDNLIDNIEIIYLKDGKYDTNSLSSKSFDEAYDLEIISSNEFNLSEEVSGSIINDNEIISFKKISNNKKYIVLRYNKENFIEELFYFQKNSIIIAIISMFVSAQIIIILIFNITKPIKDLTKKCKDIEREEYNTFEPSHRNDELGLLSNSLNNMMVTINQRTERIKYLNYINEKIIKNAPTALFLINQYSKIYKNNKMGEKLIKLNLKEENTSLSLVDFLKENNKNNVYEFNSTENKKYFLDLNSSEIENFGSIVSINDITKRREMELKMDHMNKMSSLGRIAASIAHEIRNPLTGIRAGIQVLYKRSEKSDMEIYHSLINEIDRMNELVSEILNYSKINKSKKIKCDLYEVLVSTLDLYKDSISSLEIEYNLGEKPKYVMALIDPNQMKQIFMNIISNSLNAMDKPKKELSIDIYNTKSDNNFKRINVVIKDNGKGIKNEDMDKIYDPFYTNHKKGVGLGLSVVKKLVDENNGTIDIKSEYRNGTSVKLIFEVI